LLELLILFNLKHAFCLLTETFSFTALVTARLVSKDGLTVDLFNVNFFVTCWEPLEKQI